MHAPGQWWLVRTIDNSVNIQEKYGGCGPGPGRGGALLKGVPRTCGFGMAMGGSFMDNKNLTVLPGCDWDWGKQSCAAGSQSTPRITYNGNKKNGAFQEGNVRVTVSGSTVEAFLPQNIHVKMHVYHFYMNVFVTMNARKHQCGHCGNFDGVQDLMYEQTGELKDSWTQDRGLCNANIACNDRMMDEAWGCKANIPPGETFDINKVPQDLVIGATNKCKAAFVRDNVGKQEHDMEADELNDCVRDAIVGGDRFIEDDAQAANEEEEEVARLER
jgi:hypothetical protein